MFSGQSLVSSDILPESVRRRFWGMGQQTAAADGGEERDTARQGLGRTGEENEGRGGTLRGMGWGWRFLGKDEKGEVGLSPNCCFHGRQVVDGGPGCGPGQNTCSFPSRQNWCVRRGAEAIRPTWLCAPLRVWIERLAGGEAVASSCWIPGGGLGGLRRDEPGFCQMPSAVPRWLADWRGWGASLSERTADGGAGRAALSSVGLIFVVVSCWLSERRPGRLWLCVYLWWSPN